MSVSIRPTEPSEAFGDRFADDPVRVAVVGLGYWGPNLVRNLQTLRGADLQMICDQNPQRLDQIIQRYPTSRTTVDFADVLEDDAIEAVVIATPIGTHFRLADAALRAGKHVFVEKPLAASSRRRGPWQPRRPRAAWCCCPATRSCTRRRCSRSAT